MSLTAYQIIKRPIVTEKSTKGEAFNRVVFEVDVSASKHQIKEAVEKVFKVGVIKVNTMRVRGKPYGRFGRMINNKKTWKKAIVTLKEGDRIDFFEGA